MAKVLQGVFGGFSGSMGNVTGASWKGINYMRLKAVSVANPQTAGQVAQRSRFSFTVMLAQNLLAIIVKPLWDRFAVRQSGYNNFVGVNVKIAVDWATTVWADLIMSKGKMALTAIVTSDLDNTGGELNMTWDDDSGQGFKLSTDKAYIVFINKTTETLIGIDTGQTRVDGLYMADPGIPFNAGDEVHTYLMFLRPDGTVVSDSSYRQAADL